MGAPNSEWGQQVVEDVAGLKLDVGGLKADVAGLKADVAGLKADAGEIRGSVSSLRNDFVEFRGELRGMLRVAGAILTVFGLALVSAVSYAAIGVTRLESQLDGISGRMAGVERSVEALSARVDGIADRLAMTEGKIDALAIALGPAPSAPNPTNFDPEARRAVGADDQPEPPLELREGSIPGPQPIGPSTIGPGGR